MPMESLTGKPEWVGDGAVCRGMSAAEVRQCMEAAYCAVPQAAGVNNHMGSAVMEDANTLGCVLDVVREKGGVFVDSVTTAESKCGTLAVSYTHLGEAAAGLANLVEQAGGTVCGIAAIIEKEFQGGSKKLRDAGYLVDSLAVITKVENGKIYFKD